MQKALVLLLLSLLTTPVTAQVTPLSNSDVWDIYTTEQGRACINISYGRTDSQLVDICQQYAVEIDRSYASLISKDSIYRYLGMIDHYGCVKEWQDNGAEGAYAEAVRHTKKSRVCAGIWRKLNRLG